MVLVFKKHIYLISFKILECNFAKKKKGQDKRAINE